MTVPSSVGLTPRSDSRMAVVMAFIAERSKGLMITVRASGMVMEASCWSGVGAP